MFQTVSAKPTCMRCELDENERGQCCEGRACRRTCRTSWNAGSGPCGMQASIPHSMAARAGLCWCATHSMRARARGIVADVECVRAIAIARRARGAGRTSRDQRSRQMLRRSIIISSGAIAVAAIGRARSDMAWCRDKQYEFSYGIAMLPPRLASIRKSKKHRIARGARTRRAALTPIGTATEEKSSEL